MRSTRLRCVPLLTATVLTAGLLLAPTASTAQGAAAAATPAPVEPLDVVVLGDSYSAGNGATDDAGQPDVYGPVDCYRSRVGWAEKYAAALREQGRTVNLANHACSGGRAPDIIKPRPLDTAAASTQKPAGVTTLAQADAYLVRADTCNTFAFPGEEFWTYRATAVASTIDFDCTRTLRPQVDFITADTDLVVFTMGGNDAGFTNIVTQCFILKMGAGCQGTIDTARAKLPEIKQLLLDDIEAIRAAGLRDDAKIVQLGYPYLQTDNGYLALGVPPYAAGDAVRSLIDDGTTALASVPVAANVGHPGQMTFVPGMQEAFAGHEPDATTPAGNIDRWVNQTGDGTNTSLWYHPNGLGQTAYASVLLRGGDYGATPTTPAGPTDPGPVVEPAPPVRTTFRAEPVRRSVAAGRDVLVRTIVRRSDGSRPRGTVLVRFRGKIVATAPVAATGRTVLRLPLRRLKPGRHQVRAVHLDGQRRRATFVTFVVRRS